MGRGGGTGVTKAGGRMGTGAWRLRTSRTACASPVRSANTSRPHLASSIGRPGEVHWPGAYSRPGTAVKSQGDSEIRQYRPPPLRISPGIPWSLLGRGSRLPVTCLRCPAPSGRSTALSPPTSLGRRVIAGVWPYGLLVGSPNVPSIWALPGGNGMARTPWPWPLMTAEN